MRGLGGSQTWGLHNGIGGSLGGYVGRNTPAGNEGWSMVLDGWAAWGNMLVVGEVVIALSSNESTPRLGCSGVGSSSLACGADLLVVVGPGVFV